MRKIGSLCLSMLLLACLLVGCTAGPGSTSSTSSVSVDESQSESTALEAPQQYEGDTWQELYYDVAAKNLELKNGMSASTILLYYWQGECPIMVIEYSTYSSSYSLKKMWRIDNKSPVLIYEGDKYQLVVNKRTGNPVYNVETETGNLFVEFDGENEIPLYEWRKKDSDSYERDLYVYSEDKLYEWPESEEVDLYDKLGVAGADVYQTLRDYNASSFAGDTKFSAQSALRVLGCLFLDNYRPPVPAEAPAWVAEFMKAMYQHRFAFYDREQLLDMSKLYFTELELLEGIDENSAPILYAEGIISIDQKNYFVVFNEGMETAFVEYLYSKAPMGFVATLEKDNKGNILYLGRAADGGYSMSYSRLKKDGLEDLFSANDGINNGQIAAVCDDQTLPLENIEDWEEIERWLYTQTDIALAKYGCGPQSSFAELAGRTYTLPKMQTTWAELELVLIDILCEHAKEIDQWG